MAIKWVLFCGAFDYMYFIVIIVIIHVIDIIFFK